MKLSKWFVVLMLTSASAMAQEAKQADVIIMDSQIPAEAFEKTGANVKDAPGGEQKSSLPSVEEINAIFRDSGLSKHVKTWDQVDRDLFVISLRSLSLQEAMKTYPNFSKAKLIQVKTALEKLSRK